MGYTTDFEGRFNLDRTLAHEHKAYLEAFNNSRRMRRDASIAETLDDPVRLAAGLPIGKEGAYFVGFANNNHGQVHDKSVVEYDEAPGQPSYDFMKDRYDAWLESSRAVVESLEAQPGLWCQWRPTEDGSAIAWDCGEKFYYYTEWLRYLIGHFLTPWGYVLNGVVEWHGEDDEDVGRIIVRDNVVTTVKAIVTIPDSTPIIAWPEEDNKQNAGGVL